MSGISLSAPLQRLLAKPGVSALSEATLDAFTADGVSALFFTGDTNRYPEIDDLAVILPELMRVYPGAFRVGVVNPDQERKLALRFKISLRPTLMFLRDGAMIGSLPRLRDWADYRTSIAAFLDMQQV